MLRDPDGNRLRVGTPKLKRTDPAAADKVPEGYTEEVMEYPPGTSVCERVRGECSVCATEGVHGQARPRDAAIRDA